MSIRGGDPSLGCSRVKGGWSGITVRQGHQAGPECQESRVSGKE